MEPSERYNCVFFLKMGRCKDVLPEAFGGTSSDFIARYHSNHLRTKLDLSQLKIQSVPRSKHSASVIKTDQLMLYREIIAVCSQIRTKHINTLCGQNVESLNGKLVAHIATTGLIWLTQFQSLLQQLSDN